VLTPGHSYVALAVEDLDRARAFYRDKLGLEAAQDNPAGSSTDWTAAASSFST
jgi:catechol 2,3-dioxygenase-like lactoylglutathione lyase family enzyme